MNTPNLKLYAKFLKKKQAFDEILKDLQPLAFKELKKQPEGKAIVSEVEFHITSKTKITYPESVTEQVNQLREDARNSGKAKSVSTLSFDAQIPKSAKDRVLSVVNDYKKHFSL